MQAKTILNLHKNKEQPSITISGACLGTLQGARVFWQFQSVMELVFPYDVLLFASTAVIGFLLYSLVFRPKETYKTYRTVSKRFEKTNLYKTLGLAGDFYAFQDKFATFHEVSQAIKQAGLESSNLIIGVDFTASNEWQGRKSFNGKSLHHISKSSRKLNPYQRVIRIIGKTLEPFDSDNLIPAFGFGDKETKDHSVFSLKDKDRPCKGLEDVLDTYNSVVQRVSLSGPTSFAPIIDKAVEIVKAENSYHILVVIADGQVVEAQDDDTRDSIVNASNYPLSIVVVGVGDGPWDVMHEYDEYLPRRRFDNFQFIEFRQVTDNAKYPDTAFALHALMEIPDQYIAIRRLRLIPESDRENKNGKGLG